MKTKFSFIQLTILLVLIIIGMGCSRSRELKLSATIPEIEKTKEAKILTAFFGLDNALPQKARALYIKAAGKDGMPVIFSMEIDPTSLDATDFEVTTKNGETFEVESVTLLPAEEEFELRTVLLIGEFGNYPDNPPILVKIVGDLKSRTGANFKKQQAMVIPLEEGPILSYAEYFTLSDDYPYVEKGIGCDCPKAATKMVVKTVWAGGVRAVNGEELGANEINNFQVTMVNGADTSVVIPFQLADLKDNDNNIDLCLKEDGIPIKVVVLENTAIDPRGDKNSRTEIKVMNRW